MADDTTESRRSRGRRLRYVLAFVALLGIGLIYLLSIFGPISVCREEVAEVATKAVVSLCGSIPLPDLIPLGAIVLLLLVPDYDIDFLGLFGVKRRQEEVGRLTNLEAARPAPASTREVDVADTKVAESANNVAAALGSTPVGQPGASLNLVAPELESAIEVVRTLAKADDLNANVIVLTALKKSDVYALGQPAGKVADGQGSESDLLHFKIDDAAGIERVMLPLFTNQDAMREALRRNGEWWTLSVLQVDGSGLWENVDLDVIVVINPWSDLEFQLPKSPKAIARPKKDEPRKKRAAP